MRKNIVPRQETEFPEHPESLDLEKLARIEMTSEDPSHPIESALHQGGTGWRAATSGPQVIRFLFDQPQSIRYVDLLIVEDERSRTQEFVLRSSQGDRSFREIVRQQYNFNPPGTTTEKEKYDVNLSGVTALELEINPDIGGSDAKASLTRLHIG